MLAVLVAFGVAADVVFAGLAVRDPAAWFAAHDRAQLAPPVSADLADKPAFMQAMRDAYRLDLLSEDDWMGLMVFHPYAGPLPAAFYPWFQLVDYGVHSWDMREHRGEPHALAGDTADLLVPLGLIVWQITADTDNVTEPFSIGVRNTAGANAGTWRMNVSKEGLTYEPGPVDDLPAVLEFDPATLVLTSYGRVPGGTTQGDPGVADRFRSLFFRI